MREESVVAMDYADTLSFIYFDELMMVSVGICLVFRRS
jgi:hypothetical protein